MAYSDGLTDSLPEAEVSWEENLGGHGFSVVRLFRSVLAFWVWYVSVLEVGVTWKES